MNMVILSGRLVRDPEIRYGSGAEPMCIAKFSLAVDKNYKKSADDKANFINCTAFGKTGEVVEKHCTKGTKLIVTGEWTTGSYKNKDGNTVYTTDVVVEEQEFCESKSSNQSQGNDRPQASSDGFISIPDGLDDTGLPFN